MATLQKVYRFRMCPNREQEHALFRFAGARRWVWNWALSRRTAYYAEFGEGISKSQLSKELTELKSRPETAWLKDADSQALQQVLQDLDKAFKNFFERRAKFPRFKSRKRTDPSFRIPQRVQVADGNVYVPKIGLVKIRQSQAVEGTSKSATFKRDACGHWFVTLVVAFAMPDVSLPKPNPEAVIGLDAGLKDFAVLSSGESIETPKFFRKGKRRLRRVQKSFCRRVKGSRRRDKARRKIARIHQKIGDKRKDFLHKLSTRLVNRFEGICIEDLNVKGLARTKLAKSFNDAAHGEFRRQLEYKSTWNRKHLFVVGRFFASSKMCGGCGAVNETLGLSDRQWTCFVCGVSHDRDHNASRNIRAEGLRLFAVGHTENPNVRGDNVRPPARAAVVSEPRIPRL